MHKKIIVKVNGTFTEEIKNNYNQELAYILVEQFGIEMCIKLLNMLDKH